jgi:hypothetical protein
MTGCVQTNLWIGSKGVVAEMHYDTSDNFFLVLNGSKQFSIWPPELLPAARVYPSLHPYYRQSSVWLALRDDLLLSFTPSSF